MLVIVFRVLIGGWLFNDLIIIKNDIIIKYDNVSKIFYGVLIYVWKKDLKFDIM